MSIKRSVYRCRPGSMNNLQKQDELLGVPQDHEVQIEVGAIGLNFADIFAIWGIYGATPKGEFIPGLEYAGRVLEVGAKVEDVRRGQTVMGITRFGAYATHLNIDHRYIVPLPQEWQMDEGAAYLVQVLTAYYALFNLGDLQESQRVLIHSGAGGVGIMALRLAKKMNAFTIGTTGSPAKVDFMYQQGYDAVIVRSKRFSVDLHDALAGKPLHLVLECIGGKILKDGFNALAPEGRMVVYGSAQYASPGSRPNYLRMLWKYLTRPKIDPLSLPNKNRSMLGFNLIWLYEQVEKMHALLLELDKMSLPPPHIGHNFSFDELPQALRLFQAGGTVGKVVVRTRH